MNTICAFVPLYFPSSLLPPGKSPPLCSLLQGRGAVRQKPGVAHKSLWLLCSTGEGDFSGLDKGPKAGEKLASLSIPSSEDQIEIPSPPAPPDQERDKREKREAILTNPSGRVTQADRTVNNP